MSKSKKGSAYEREISKQLSRWWSFNKYDDVFWRTSQSGGRATSRFKKGARTADSYGDIGAIREEGKPLTRETFIEIKRGYTGKKGKKRSKYISITDLLDNPRNLKHKPILVQWWREAHEKRKQAGRKRTFIIFRRDRKTACIIMSRKVFLRLENKKRNGKMMCPPYFGWAWIQLGIIAQLMIIPLEDFFKWCDPRTLGGRRIIKRR